MDRDKAPHCKAMSDYPHCKRILSSVLTEPQEAPQRRGTTETETFFPLPQEGTNFSNCHKQTKCQVRWGPGSPQPLVEKPFPTPGGKIPRFLPLCAPKSVPTPQMRQSKVWEHSPEIGVRHIHRFLSSVHCEFKAMSSKRRWEEKIKGEKYPNYLRAPSREKRAVNCGLGNNSVPVGELPVPCCPLISAQPSERFRKLTSSCVCPLLGSLGQL